MTLTEMLRFSGGVLGPALLAQAFAETLHQVPDLAPRENHPPSEPPSPDVDRLLRQAFPNGLASL